MRLRSPFFWWPLVAVALLAGCEDENTPVGSGGAGGSGGSAMPDGGSTTTTTGSGGTGGAGGTAGTAGAAGSGGTVTPPGDGGLAPCIESPTDLDRPPSGSLPCDMLPPGFVAK
jgi:hypothetical protein